MRRILGYIPITVINNGSVPSNNLLNKNYVLFSYINKENKTYLV